MKKKYKKRYKRRMLVIGMASIAIMAGITGFSNKNKPDNKIEEKPQKLEDQDISRNTEGAIKEKEEDKVNTITISTLGNMMFHQKQLDGAVTEDGYDFSPSFEHIKGMVSDADIAIGVFEGSVAGGTPTGFPNFNSPVEAIKNFKDAGIDILNINSNHIYDGGNSGYINTVNEVRKSGMEPLGVRDGSDDKKYYIKQVGEAKIGFIAYTYETYNNYGQRTINSNVLSNEACADINLFDYGNLDGFYSDIESQISAMKEEGADYIITSMHWGEEYDTTENHYQSTIAKELNKLGVDIIIGGHPHVIQPYEVIKGEDGKDTFVLYSQGNLLSNQCAEEIGIPESEDGIIANFTLEVDGEKVSLKDTEIVPTWVYRSQREDGTYSHVIIPVKEAISNKEKFGLTDSAYEKVKQSLVRTEQIVGSELIK